LRGEGACGEGGGGVDPIGSPAFPRSLEIASSHQRLAERHRTARTCLARRHAAPTCPSSERAILVVCCCKSSCGNGIPNQNGKWNEANGRCEIYGAWGVTACNDGKYESAPAIAPNKPARKESQCGGPCHSAKDTVHMGKLLGNRE